MSLGIAFKGPEGIVLAADSRVTLMAEMEQNQERRLLPSTFDNATKLLQINKQKHIGVVTYGLGAIGQQEPRTAHSFLPELDEKLPTERMSVADFTDKLGQFFLGHWRATMPENWQGPDITFLVGGYDESAVYGRVFQINIPSHPEGIEWNAGAQFGVTWGGQLEYINRLVKGFDPRLPSVVERHLELNEEQRKELEQHLERELSSRIPYQFLPLQDCVDLSVFLIRTTIELQAWIIGVRGVGGAIDVATITRTDGFEPIRRKTIVARNTEKVRKVE
jgi:hypothetical protein